jgi:urease accessory protein
MIVANAILGDVTDPAFAARTVDELPVTSRDAERRRLRGTTAAGVEVRVDLAEPRFLRHGAVLSDDGERAIVVQRVPEEAVVVRLDPAAAVAELVSAALLLGHALGNQHVPIEVHGTQLYVPITTSARLALESVRAAAPISAAVTLERVRLGAERPLWAGRSDRPAHGHGHGHDHGDSP